MYIYGRGLVSQIVSQIKSNLVKQPFHQVENQIIFILQTNTIPVYRIHEIPNA